jgi:glycosyltransferase involved in cell wall biosynthesis
MRVLLVTHYFPPHVGGIENVAWQQARHLTELGVEVTVLTSGSETADHGCDDRIRVVRVPAYNGLERRTGIPFPVFGPQLWTAARRWATWADVVHVHDCLYLSSWAAARAAARTATPLVMTQHIAVVDHPIAVVGAAQRMVYALAGRRLLAQSRHTAVVNGAVADFARALGARPETVRLMPNGVDTALFRPPTDVTEREAIRVRFGLPAAGVLVLFVGRPVPKKGYRVLLEARHPDYHLVFAGERPSDAEDGLGVLHLGPLRPAQLAEVYRACDIFALPSTAEGFPLTVQEAMASGLPVVTTNDPGYASYGFDPSGIALVPRDSATQRATLLDLASDADKRRSMGAYSVRYATDMFSWPKHAQTLAALYRDVTSGRPSTVDNGQPAS